MTNQRRRRQPLLTHFPPPCSVSKMGGWQDGQVAVAVAATKCGYAPHKLNLNQPNRRGQPNVKGGMSWTGLSYLSLPDLVRVPYPPPLPALMELAASRSPVD